MENAFIYDLATTRNPRSGFSYTNYLLAQNRLIEFANSDRMNPLREEFEDYLRWCADQFKEEVQYGCEVVGVVTERDSTAVQGWSVAFRDTQGKTQMLRTKNILAPSSRPKEETSQPLTSVNFQAGQRIVSFEDYLSQRNNLREAREPRIDIAVVGSGQQAIEIVDDLLTCPRLGNVTVVTENEALSPLRILGDEAAPPPPRLCSIWAKPSSSAQSGISASSELIQNIYLRAYEKQLASKGQYALRVVIGKDTAGPTSKANIIIAEKANTHMSASGLFHGLDALVLGCQQKGESLEEVQFKRGAVTNGCSMWLLSAHSEGGRSLAKDVAVRAGEVVRGLAEARETGREGSVVINARM